jgi:hypothetical protein
VSETGHDGAPRNDGLLDSQFLSELQELAAAAGRLKQPPAALQAAAELQAFLAPLPGSERELSEDSFVALPPEALTERTDALLESARRSAQPDAAQAVDAFVVFFQALLPGLGDEGEEQARRLFFRLVPTLLHVCHVGFAGPSQEGAEALRRLETILIEVSSVKLSPAESGLVARSIEQLTGFIAAGEYALANDVVSSQLLAILEKNRVARMLYRLMQVEASVQVYIKQKLGYATPRLRVPNDFAALRSYGPVRILEEDDLGRPRRLIQVQLPDVAMPRHVVLQLAPGDGGPAIELRFDRLGCAELEIPSGSYDLGLLYRPDPR